MKYGFSPSLSENACHPYHVLKRADLPLRIEEARAGASTSLETEQEESQGSCYL